MCRCVYQSFHALDRYAVKPAKSRRMGLVFAVVVHGRKHMEVLLAMRQEEESERHVMRDSRLMRGAVQREID